MVEVSLSPLDSAITSAVPSATPVTTPDPDTLATPVLVERNRTLGLFTCAPLVSTAVTVSPSDSFTWIVADDGDTVSESSGTKLGGAVVTESPHPMIVAIAAAKASGRASE